MAAFWVLDDITPLRQYTDDVAQKDAFLYYAGDGLSHSSGAGGSGVRRSGRGRILQRER